MKRVGYIYEDIISVENCKLAILNAAKGKKRRKNVINILNNVDRYAVDLSERLQRLDFLSPYHKKTIKDGLSGKIREVEIPNFYPDQCGHHAIIQVLQPIIMKSSYYWSCANIPKRGLDHASKIVSRATIKDTRHCKYCVKCDIRKFYPSVSHDVMKKRFREKIKDEKALAIIFTVIDSTKGISIGNYTSPWFAELLLQPFDHFVKEKLGIRYYIRYADDIVLIDNNKRKMRRALQAIIEFIKGLQLEIKSNYQLFKVLRGKSGRKIDFVGKCFAVGYTTIRKRRALAFMRQSRLIQKLQNRKAPIPYTVAASFLSRSSCLLHTNSFGLRLKYYEPIDINALKEVVRNESKRKLIAKAT